MLFTLSQEDQMLKDLVARFVKDELMPLEQKVLARDAAGTGPLTITREEQDRLDARAKELGLWGLDAPAEFGGSDLPVTSMIGVNEELGRCALQYRFPPDSPNLHMLMKVCNEEQRQHYLAPYARGDARSAIAISEPSGGGDPASMKTRAARARGGWVINGRKIWVSGVASADFVIVMAVTDPEKRARGGISAFLVDKDTPGFTILRKIAMIGGRTTYELAFDDCWVPESKLLGRGRQRLRPDAIAPLDPPRADRRHLRRPREAGSGHDGRVRAAAQNLRRSALRTAGHPVVDRGRRDEDPRDAADDLRRGGKGIARRGGADRSFHAEDIRDRDGHGNHRPRPAILRRDGDDAGDAVPPDGRAVAGHADLRGPNGGPSHARRAARADRDASDGSRTNGAAPALEAGRGSAARHPVHVAVRSGIPGKARAGGGG